jgi:pyrrolidone-carboxylate peptidase
VKIRASASPWLLITCFEPFGGRRRNASVAVSQHLVRELSQRLSHWHTEVWELPVAFIAAPRQVMDRLVLAQKAGLPPPRGVLCLGEARHGPRLETVAHNRENCPGHPDNRGVERHNASVLPGGPDEVALPLTRALATGWPDHGSTDCGAYVCNHTAYLLAQELAPRKIPVGFVHVPAEGFEDWSQWGAVETAAFLADALTRWARGEVQVQW